MKRFVDRSEAGLLLAERLAHYARQPDAVVIGLPRGGVVTAYEVAKALALPLDIIVPRKIGVPGQEELAAGALIEDGSVVWNESVLKLVHLNKDDLLPMIERERKEAERRLNLYRGNRPPLDLHGKTAIIVDDGLATGATMLAAIASAHKKGASQVIVAVPVASKDGLEKIESQVKHVVCPMIERMFLGVGQFFQNFEQTEDEEVIDLMAKSRNWSSPKKE